MGIKLGLYIQFRLLLCLSFVYYIGLCFSLSLSLSLSLQIFCISSSVARYGEGINQSIMQKYTLQYVNAKSIKIIKWNTLRTLFTQVSIAILLIIFCSIIYFHQSCHHFCTRHFLSTTGFLCRSEKTHFLSYFTQCQ